ncbi:hypothetical protein [Oceanicoccus sagamiensis]|nr:hypothetical protein [Oceanicoccus sagamiensis]
MSIKSVWESKHQLYNLYLGKVGVDDLIEATLHFSGSAKADDLHTIICDWTLADIADMTVADLDRLVAHVGAWAKTSPDVKQAVVMPGDESRQGLASMYGFLSDNLPWQVEVFASLEEARAWLDA